MMFSSDMTPPRPKRYRLVRLLGLPLAAALMAPSAPCFGAPGRFQHFRVRPQLRTIKPTAPNNGPTVNDLQLRIRTGNDDLRGGTVAYAQIRLRNGTSLPRVNLNGGAQWRNGSTHTNTLYLPRNTPMSSLIGGSLTISHDGAGRNFGETYDNWNIDSMSLQTPRVCQGGYNIAAGDGRPWHRFTGQDTSARLPFRVPPTARNQLAQNLVMTLRTGNDDLRGGAVAYAQIRLRNGRTLPRVNLNHGANWPNGSTHRVVLLPGRRGAVPLGDLASLTISHDGAGRNFGETYDNWNLDQVTIYTRRMCRTETLAGRSGRPWVRLTGSRTSVSVGLQAPR